MNHQPFSIAKRIKSFIYAFNGLKILFREEHNSRIHFFAALIAIVLGIVLGIAPYEWIVIIFCIALVLAAEIINTAIEHIANFLTTEHNSQIKIIKDLSAAAVLVCAFAAFIIALVIFIPKIIG